MVESAGELDLIRVLEEAAGLLQHGRSYLGQDRNLSFAVTVACARPEANLTVPDRV